MIDLAVFFIVLGLLGVGISAALTCWIIVEMYAAERDEHEH